MPTRGRLQPSLVNPGASCNTVGMPKGACVITSQSLAIDWTCRKKKQLQSLKEGQFRFIFVCPCTEGAIYTIKRQRLQLPFSLRRKLPYSLYQGSLPNMVGRTTGVDGIRTVCCCWLTLVFIGDTAHLAKTRNQFKEYIMLHKDGMTWQVRLGVLVAVVVALLGGVVYPAQADLLVSVFTGNQARKFTNAGVFIPPVPFFDLSGGGGSGGEGFVCFLRGGTTPTGLVFASDEGRTLLECDINTANSCVPFATSPLPTAAYSAVALSIDGSLLYAVDNTNNRIDAYNTSTHALSFTVSTMASHDIRVGPDGTVYATSFVNNTGVERF